ARLSLGRTQRDAEDQELSQRRLRGRGLPVQRGQTRGRLALARPLRPGRPPAPRGLHLDDRGARQKGAHAEARETRRAAGVHRWRAWRSEPMVHRPLGAVAAAETEARGRGSLRPFLGTALPPWNETSALAARQIAAPVHHGSGDPEAGKPRQAFELATTWLRRKKKAPPRRGSSVFGKSQGAISPLSRSDGPAPVAGPRRPDRSSRAYWRPGFAGQGPFAGSRRSDRWSTAC